MTNLSSRKHSILHLWRGIGEREILHWCELEYTRFIFAWALCLLWYVCFFSLKSSPMQTGSMASYDRWFFMKTGYGLENRRISLWFARELRDLFPIQMCRFILGYIQPLAMYVLSPIYNIMCLRDVNVPTTFRCT